MEEIQREAGTTETPLPCQYFDLIGGTGTGGIITLMLGRLGMVRPQRLKTLTSTVVRRKCHKYIELAERVFRMDHVRRGNVPVSDDQCHFDSKDMEEALKALVKGKLGDENSIMAHDSTTSGQQPKSCPTFVVATSAMHADGPPSYLNIP